MLDKIKNAPNKDICKAQINVLKNSLNLEHSLKGLLQGAVSFDTIIKNGIYSTCRKFNDSISKSNFLNDLFSKIYETELIEYKQSSPITKERFIKDSIENDCTNSIITLERALSAKKQLADAQAELNSIISKEDLDEYALDERTQELLFTGVDPAEAIVTRMREKYHADIESGIEKYNKKIKNVDKIITGLLLLKGLDKKDITAGLESIKDSEFYREDILENIPGDTNISDILPLLVTRYSPTIKVGNNNTPLIKSINCEFRNSHRSDGKPSIINETATLSKSLGSKEYTEIRETISKNINLQRDTYTILAAGFLNELTTQTIEVGNPINNQSCLRSSIIKFFKYFNDKEINIDQESVSASIHKMLEI